MSEKAAANLLVLDAVDKPETMADDAVENGEPKAEDSEGRQESSKHRRRSRSPVNPPGRRGRGGGSGRRYGGYRGVDRDSIDNKTNSEEPHLKRARLFVGNISTENVKRRDLARLFSQYGRVLGVSIHGGYAFVQMDRERDANRAIISEDGNNFMGSKIHVEFSQAAKQAGARAVHHHDPTPPPLMQERERDYAATAAAHLDERISREERLERLLILEREMAYVKAREDLYTEMFSRSQLEPPVLPLFEHRREESYRRPPPSPPPSNPYPPPRDRDYHVEHSERGLDDQRPYYSRSEASGSFHGQSHDSRTDLLSYPLPRNRGGSGSRGAELLAAAYGGAATSGKSVGYGGMSGGGGGGGNYGSSKTQASGGYALGKAPSGWLSSHDYPRGGGGGGSSASRGGPYSSGGYWN